MTSEVDEVTRADREAAEAHAEVETLEGRVADGDEQISSEQVAEAHAMSRFARLRAQGARRRAERQRQQQRRDEAGRLLAELDSDGEGSVRASQQAVEQALGEAQQAVQRLVQLSEEHGALVGGYVNALGRLRDVLPDGVRVHSGSATDLWVGQWSARAVSRLGAIAAAVGPVLSGNLDTSTPNGPLIRTGYLQERAKGFRP